MDIAKYIAVHDKVSNKTFLLTFFKDNKIKFPAKIQYFEYLQGIKIKKQHKMCCFSSNYLIRILK